MEYQSYTLFLPFCEKSHNKWLLRRSCQLPFIMDRKQPFFLYHQQNMPGSSMHISISCVRKSNGLSLIEIILFFCRLVKEHRFLSRIKGEELFLQQLLKGHSSAKFTSLFFFELNLLSVDQVDSFDKEKKNRYRQSNAIYPPPTQLS